MLSKILNVGFLGLSNKLPHKAKIFTLLSFALAVYVVYTTEKAVNSGENYSIPNVCKNLLVGKYFGIFTLYLFCLYTNRNVSLPITLFIVTSVVDLLALCKLACAYLQKSLKNRDEQNVGWRKWFFVFTLMSIFITMCTCPVVLNKINGDYAFSFSFYFVMVILSLLGFNSFSTNCCLSY